MQRREEPLSFLGCSVFSVGEMGEVWQSKLFASNLTSAVLDRPASKVRVPTGTGSQGLVFCLCCAWGSAPANASPKLCVLAGKACRCFQVIKALVCIESIRSEPVQGHEEFPPLLFVLGLLGFLWGSWARSWAMG